MNEPAEPVGSGADSRHDLEELRASLGRLMRGLNHDLKNPLGAADGYLELMLQGFRGELTHDQRETLARIRTLIAAAVDILEDVVTYTRASLGELSVGLSASDLSAVARMAVEAQRERAERQNVRLDLDNGSVEARTVTDADLVGQILRQLLANALDHTESDGHVQVRLERDAETIAIAVSDDGPGIVEDARERIFLEFEKGAPPSQTRETAGVGFGLPLARALADRLGGQLGLESTLGQGATFTLTLPIR